MQKYYYCPASWLCIGALCFCTMVFSCTTKDSNGSGTFPSDSPTPIVSALVSVTPNAEPSKRPTATSTPDVGSTVSPSPTASLQPIQVSKEVFTQTFSQVEQLINNLNEIIKRKDYPAWTVFLSESYKSRMDNPEYLKQMNQSATLQKNNITLKTFEDYFNFVVVPSRANLRLDDLVFLTETEVEAIMVVGNRRVTLYRLIKIGERWMIGLS